MFSVSGKLDLFKSGSGGVLPLPLLGYAPAFIIPKLGSGVKSVVSMLSKVME